MSRDDIIRMAREVDIKETWWTLDDLERFAALVAAAEREACIDDCNAEARDDGTAQRVVERIRARG
jgi:hypothetical protein